MHGSADGTPYSVRSVLNMDSFQCDHSPNSTVFGTIDDHPQGIYHVLGMTDGTAMKVCQSLGAGSAQMLAHAWALYPWGLETPKKRTWL